MDKLLQAFRAQTALTKATRASSTRRSGTVADTVRHSIIHTESPDATLHHTVIGASPYPEKSRAALGDYYMTAYVSIHISWLVLLSQEVIDRWKVSFIGPAGLVQRLPYGISESEALLGQRIYVGFDWLAYAKEQPAQQQPSYERIQSLLIAFVTELRKASV